MASRDYRRTSCGCRCQPRAPVGKEHIETEMRTANGIINSHNQLIAAVVLITAGYAADGKYSHFLLIQSPLVLDGHLTLQPGSYVVGWRRLEEGLEVHMSSIALRVRNVAPGSHVQSLEQRAWKASISGHPVSAKISRLVGSFWRIRFLERKAAQEN